jgi:hypothetical protein
MYICMTPVIEDPGASSVWRVCVSMSVRPDHKVQVFQTAHQTVFIAGLSYLAHPPTHILTPLLTLGQGHVWRVLDLGFKFAFNVWFSLLSTPLLQWMWCISLVSMAHLSTHIHTTLLTQWQGQGHFWTVLDLGFKLRLTFSFHSVLLLNWFLFVPFFKN